MEYNCCFGRWGKFCVQPPDELPYAFDIFPMFSFRENYNLLNIERFNGNNNRKWCSTTLKNQNKQQWHVWFITNDDDNIFEYKLLMKNIHHISLWWPIGRQIRPWVSWSFLYSSSHLKYWLFYFSFSFIWLFKAYGGNELLFSPTPHLESIYLSSLTFSIGV